MSKNNSDWVSGIDRIFNPRARARLVTGKPLRRQPVDVAAGGLIGHSAKNRPVAAPQAGEASKINELRNRLGKMASCKAFQQSPPSRAVWTGSSFVRLAPECPPD
jgi:hypothetical protein